MSRRAFTLVELLVVIAIIGLLSTIGIVAMTSARMQSRNTRRLADMKQLLTAFQLGFDANGSYPAGQGCISATCMYGWSGIAANGTVDAFFSPFLSPKPAYPSASPPITLGGYIYSGSWGGGTSGYSGITYPAQPILDWAMEGSTNCGFGVIWSQSASYTECIFLIKNT